MTFSPFSVGSPSVSLYQSGTFGHGGGWPFGPSYRLCTKAPKNQPSFPSRSRTLYHTFVCPPIVSSFAPFSSIRNPVLAGYVPRCRKSCSVLCGGARRHHSNGQSISGGCGQPRARRYRRFWIHIIQWSDQKIQFSPRTNTILKNEGISIFKLISILPCGLTIKSSPGAIRSISPDCVARHDST
jgi:hypothetical protein